MVAGAGTSGSIGMSVVFAECRFQMQESKIQWLCSYQLTH